MSTRKPPSTQLVQGASTYVKATTHVAIDPDPDRYLDLLSEETRRRVLEARSRKLKESQNA